MTPTPFPEPDYRQDLLPQLEALAAQYLGDLADTVARYRRALEQIRREIGDYHSRQPTSPMLARLDAIARKALSQEL